MYRWTVFREIGYFNLTVVFAYSVVLSPDCIYNYLSLLIITYLLIISKLVSGFGFGDGHLLWLACACLLPGVWKWDVVPNSTTTINEPLEILYFLLASG